MRPRRLELEGFGAFREPCTVDFSDIELVALVGATGSGKSTIIDAITFALYGSVARYDDKGVVAPVINQTSTRARVRLDFEVGDEQFTAVRLVQRTARGATTKEARLERGDEIVAADARSMSTEVGRLLGLDVDQFNRTVVLPQGRFADFLHDQPRDRQKTLRQLLGLEMYQRIGSAARQRAATVRHQVDALRPDLTAGERELTDEHRAGLVAHLEVVQDVRLALIETLGRLAPMDADLATLVRRQSEVEAQRALVAAVRPPRGVAELEQRAGASDDEVEETLAALTAARARHRAADAAVAAAPDLAQCSGQLQRRRDAAAAVAEHDGTTADLAAAEQRCEVARRAADDVASAQAALDAETASRRVADHDARQAREAGPNPVRVEHWLSLRARRAERNACAEASTTASADAQRAVVPLTAAAADADAAETEARRRRDDVQQRAGAAGFAGLLEVGAPCPLCLHDVDALPEHHVSDDVERAGLALAAATGALTAARDELQRAQRTADELRARAEADRRELAAIDADLEGVPDDATLTAQLVRAVDLSRAAEVAAIALESAEVASAAHRNDPANSERLAVAERGVADVARLRVLAESHGARRDVLLAELAGVPDEATLAAAIAEAQRAADECHAAAAEHHAAEAVHDAAIISRSEVAAELRQAAGELLAVRDRVAVLDPPPLTGERPAADWSVLTAWATRCHAELASARATTAAACGTLAAERDRAERTAREVCSAVVGSAAETDELPALRDRLTEAETSAAAAIATFDDRRVRLEALRERVDGLVADGVVAEQLGHLLRADGFEAWLMQAALEELVEAATVRLRELSSGQFSLELVEREFMVRDHANADELRSARTLSGGETFLASLALALALADATAELSSEGSRAIESIFLDEGFGSLDPATLDVVAAAIEELGSTGRMVAVVTHIRELADRMPVRFEVTKAGSSSSVARVET